MPEITTLCHICGRFASRTCKLCGRHACNIHFDLKKDMCTSCASGKKVERKEPEPELD